MTIKNYIGSVEAHQVISATLTENATLALDIFRDYWTLGYDPEVGRDTYLSRPTSVKDSAIGRIHLKPISFNGNEREKYGHCATEECWNNWEEAQDIPSINSRSSDIPTSNEWIVYCVDSNRNACMLAYLPEEIDPHAYCGNPDNMNNFISMANSWFDENHSMPMDITDFPFLFSDNWLEH